MKGSMGDCSVDILVYQFARRELHMVIPIVGIWHRMPYIGVTIQVFLLFPCYYVRKFETTPILDGMNCTIKNTSW